MATDPELIMSSLSLASGRRVGLEGDLQEPVGFAAMAFPKVDPPPQPSFFPSPPVPASGIRRNGRPRWPSELGTTAQRGPLIIGKDLETRNTPKSSSQWSAYLGDTPY